jgi:hypothetical protein
MARDYHAFWKLYGVGLADDVLKKLYYKKCVEARARTAEGRLSRLTERP